MGNVRISDVAREAGVSLGTVSNALNHPEKVRPETLELIQQTVDRLGFIPSQSARSLAGGKSRVFGLVLPRLDHGFSLQVANGAQAEARANGYDLLIASADNDDVLEGRYLRYFMGAQMAGVLVQPMAAGESWAPSMQKTPIPTVYLNVHSDAPGIYVAADNLAEGRMLLSHAADCDARRVCMIGAADFTQLLLRAEGVREAAAEKGIELEVVEEGSWNTASDGFEFSRRLAKRDAGERPDFVICLTDVLAAGVIAGLQAEGLDVPGDIRVCGGDGNPLAWTGDVSLTTIASPGAEIGRQGVKRLIKRIGQQRGAATQSHMDLVGTGLIERASTGARRAASTNLDLGEYL